MSKTGSRGAITPENKTQYTSYKYFQDQNVPEAVGPIYRPLKEYKGANNHLEDVTNL